jgi:hypothetical protein
VRSRASRALAANTTPLRSPKLPGAQRSRSPNWSSCSCSSNGQAFCEAVVEAIDGPLGVDVDPVFSGPRDALQGALTRRTLDEVVRDDEQAGAPMYWI